MRQIATSGDEAAARKFCDYLLTLKIATRLLPEGDGTGMWVCDEDKIDLARQEYERFLREPGDPRYDQAPGIARELRRKEDLQEKDYRRRTTRLRDRMDGNAPSAADRPMTIALIVVAVLVTLGSNFGDRKSAITPALSIAPFEMVGEFPQRPEWHDLEALSSGEAWRAVTPIFLHFNILHVVFNAMMLLSRDAAVPRASVGPRGRVQPLRILPGMEREEQPAAELESQPAIRRPVRRRLRAVRLRLDEDALRPRTRPGPQPRDGPHHARLVRPVPDPVHRQHRERRPRLGADRGDGDRGDAATVEAVRKVEGGVMQSAIDREQLKGLIKAALVEIIDERRDSLRELFREVLEDIALARAIEEDRGSEVVSREEVFALLGKDP